MQLLLLTLGGLLVGLVMLWGTLYWVLRKRISRRQPMPMTATELAESWHASKPHSSR